ncbi:N-acetylmuramic acid 6-phosphate etherase [Rhodobacteraceae bacterium B1Z28]|uniref:N-acetylmuramic acid 6-phosphate etherase n=1 Tax=Ruegeria haliotis TaxID=2747601 RepID=A0ABX2PWN2_9RHOB|nr:N-acetylmuramic acid 6-phosphate etherase [Ruegeria haliotis]NVO58613.1 N-acetylmuramic acid 6-phosphate etherase [Ruegeria haliotis]
MSLPATETLTDSKVIDAIPALEAVDLMLNVQVDALGAVRKAGPALVLGADCMAKAIRSKNSIIYVAAGSSGLMALADACELPGTFGISPDLVKIHMAGGVPVDGRMPGATEDDTKAAKDVARSVSPGDALIVLSASGTTPYALQAALSAKERGATVIGIANNRDAPLLEHSDVAIHLETPSEVIAGSTRMGAGTAQKVALNLMSSLMGANLGHVYQGMMVNLVADNAKLTKRAAYIVSHIASVSQDEADRALRQSNGHVKTAILVAGGLSPSAASTLLNTYYGHLGPCLQSLSSNQDAIE